MYLLIGLQWYGEANQIEHSVYKRAVNAEEIYEQEKEIAPRAILAK